MQNTLAVADLQTAPYNVRRIQHDKQVLHRVNGRFQAVVNGKCSLSFAEGVVLSFDWRAVGQSVEHGVEFCVQSREGYEPKLDGASLVDVGGDPLSWQEQSASLLALVGALDWNEAVKESLAKTCLVSADQ